MYIILFFNKTGTKKPEIAFGFYMIIS